MQIQGGNIPQRKTCFNLYILGSTLGLTVIVRAPDTGELQFMYSEKAKKVCKISTVDLFYVVMFKFRVEISQNFVAFSEYMKF